MFEILNHTIAEGRATWAGGTSENTIHYIMVNKKSREMVIDLKIDEERDINIQSDRNVGINNKL